MAIMNHFKYCREKTTSVAPSFFWKHKSALPATKKRRYKINRVLCVHQSRHLPSDTIQSFPGLRSLELSTCGSGRRSLFTRAVQRGQLGLKAPDFRRPSFPDDRLHAARLRCVGRRRSRRDRDVLEELSTANATRTAVAACQERGVTAQQRLRLALAQLSAQQAVSLALLALAELGIWPPPANLSSPCRALARRASASAST